MTRICFEDIKFHDKEGDPDTVVMVFLKLFESDISRESLKRLDEMTISSGCIETGLTETEARNKLVPVIDRAFGNLTNKLTGCRTIYIHQNSGIPLIGSINFGIVDRGTNILEVKPITGCNIDCVFCSVSEGKSSKKIVDYVVEDDYLVNEVRSIVDYKKQSWEEDGQGNKSKIDVFINTHGEPLLYANMTSLVKGLRSIPEVGVISIITNGTILSRNLVDELVDAGLTQLNLSINAIDPAKARELAGTDAYDIDHIIDIARYLSGKVKLIIAPVWVPGLNDEEIPRLIEFSKAIGAEIGIQNFLAHKMGRKPKRQVSWDEFYEHLDAWEKETGVSLRTKEHSSFQTAPLEKPFRKGDIVRAVIVAPGRMRDEVLAEAEGRVISVVSCQKKKGQVKVKILRDKDNIFVGEQV